MKLKDLRVLALDLQATSGSPEKGFLFEAGWVSCQASSVMKDRVLRRDATSHLIRPPDNETVPERILQLTGIHSRDLQEGESRRFVWNELERIARNVAGHNGLATCHSIIHFARYEEPYIRQMASRYGKGKPYPLSVLCTHSIVKKLLPGLPRKGLRAVCGYFGIRVPPSRRCLHHVTATALIWPFIVDLLEDQEGIEKVGELEEWLTCTPSAAAANGVREFPMDREHWASLPCRPGVYRMYRSNGDILYVGKAKSLKRRVQSYFRLKAKHSERVLEMLTQARSLDVTETGSAVEAALLESDEIKKNRPPYNRALAKKGRQVVFFSPDMRGYSSEAGPRFPLGPIPSADLLQPLAKIIELLNGAEEVDDASSTRDVILGLRGGAGLDEDCFRKGIETFAKKELAEVSFPYTAGDFIKLGGLFWKEKMEEPEENNREDRKDEKGQAPEERVWTPGLVHRALKSIVRRSAFFVRRGFWFRRLADSSLVWEEWGDEGKKCWSLSFQGTRPVFKPWDSSRDKCAPPAAGRSSRLRKPEDFDLYVYDRMKVLTTELKTIVREGRIIAFFVSPGYRIDKAELERVLSWV